MKKLLLGSNNPDKATEVRALLGDLQISLVLLNEFPDIPPTIEDADTLEGNAIKKASGSLPADRHSDDCG